MSGTRSLPAVAVGAAAAVVMGLGIGLGTSGPTHAIELADIAAGEGGFAIQGAGRREPRVGGKVADAGDVNGDGVPDMIVGGTYCYASCNTSPVYVVFGAAAGTQFDIGDVARGEGGFVIGGESEEDLVGFGIAGAGDVNGDGFDDIIIGVPDVSFRQQPTAGASYVVFGKPTTEAVKLPDIVAGSGGFLIGGSSGGDRSGWSVSGAGDVNDDGLDDVVIGAPGTGFSAGSTYVAFGKETTQPVRLSDVELGLGGFVIRGENANDRSGESVSGAGDVNGDGLPDLIVGASAADTGTGEGAGASYVVFGKATTTAVELSAVSAGQGGFVIRGENADDRSGESVSGAGDVNGDGLHDLLVGAPFANRRQVFPHGASYVVFGKDTTEAVSLRDVAAGEGGFVIRGERDEDFAGQSVSGAGDVNGDGLADLIVGVRHGGLADGGASYVVFGKATTEAVELAGFAAFAGGGFLVHGVRPGDFSGFSVSGAGDLNDDGFADVLIGAPLAGQGNFGRGGVCYVVFGKRTVEPVDLSRVAAGRGGIPIVGFERRDYSRLEVSVAGDVDGDGLADLLVGAPNAAPDEKSDGGASYVVFGKSTNAAVHLDEVAAGQGGFVIRGESERDLSGESVAGPGDVNGDGLADLLVGAPQSIFRHAGASYVVFGKRTTEAVELSEVASGEGGFIIRGENDRDYAGSSLSGAGDMDGDGLADLLIGAPYASAGARDRAGMTYVVFGKETTEAVELSEIALGRGGFAILGEGVGDLSGWSVSAAGDVNGDGFDDLVIGARFADPGNRGIEGAIYVVLGFPSVAMVELSDVAAGQGGFLIRGENLGGRWAHVVAGVGDVNGDSFDDLVIGAPGADHRDKLGAGVSYVVFGKETTEVVETSDIDAGRAGFVIRGERAGDRSGSSVSAVNDIDGDGLDDILIGSSRAGSGDASVAGASYVIFGKRTTEAVELSEIATGQNGLILVGAMVGDNSGRSISGGGDVNGDNIPDLVVGMESGVRNQFDGTAYVVFGGSRAGFSRFRRGEVLGDMRVDLTDAAATLNHLFLGGDEPACLDAADSNDDGRIDITDAVTTLDYLFLGGNEPPLPGPGACGVDPTADLLGCERPPEDCR